MIIAKASRTEELLQVFPLIQELRPQVNATGFLKIVETATAQDNYSIYTISESNKFLGAIGFRFLSDLVHGRHLYVDDLVVSKEYRSKGIGSKLLAFAEEFAIKNECRLVRLCTGADNHSGMKFYDREGYSQRAVVYKKTMELN